MTTLYVEVGSRRTFACAVDWPGWCRSARAQESAIEALKAYAGRFAVVCERAGVAFDPAQAVAHLDVVEHVTGSSTTDFGALDVPPKLDDEVPSDGESRRLGRLVETAWAVFDDLSAAPAELRKGPRGGGRDRDAIVDHVLQTEVLHARMLGRKQRPFASSDRAAAESARKMILAAILEPRAERQPEPLPKGLRPVRFVARRVAWHALDHAWEIQDRM